MRLFRTVLLAIIAIAIAGCEKPAAPSTVPFKFYADSLGVERLHENAKVPANLDKAHDGLESTRWTTYGPMRKGYFVELVFDGATEVREVVLDAGPSSLDYPRAFTVETVDPAGEWENLGYYDEGATDRGITKVAFDEPKTAGRLVIRLTEDANFWWSIHEISIR